MQDRIKCPLCGELIMATAKKCRFCGEWLTQDVQTPVTSTAPTEYTPPEPPPTQPPMYTPPQTSSMEDTPYSNPYVKKVNVANFDEVSIAERTKFSKVVRGFVPPVEKLYFDGIIDKPQLSNLIANLQNIEENGYQNEWDYSTDSNLDAMWRYVINVIDLWCEKKNVNLSQWIQHRFDEGGVHFDFGSDGGFMYYLMYYTQYYGDWENSLESLRSTYSPLTTRSYGFGNPVPNDIKGICLDHPLGEMYFMKCYPYVTRDYVYDRLKIYIDFFVPGTMEMSSDDKYTTVLSDVKFAKLMYKNDNQIMNLVAQLEDFNEKKRNAKRNKIVFYGIAVAIAALIIKLMII
ncbi:MAG: hypothetical protein J6T60_00750 [Bacteroidales bacterium]|nr:hypothetical protein [Bacteroidales bacterium]